MYHGHLQEFVYIIPQQTVEVFDSIQEELNGRAHFDWNLKQMVIDGKPAAGVVDLVYADQHLNNLSGLTAGRDYVYIPHNNFYFLPWFVMFKEGVIYARDDEFVSPRAYTSMVVYKDGRINIETLLYQKGRDGAQDRIYRSQGQTEITAEVRLAFFGQQIVRNGEAVDLETIRGQ